MDMTASAGAWRRIAFASFLGPQYKTRYSAISCSVLDDKLYLPEIERHRTYTCAFSWSVEAATGSTIFLGSQACASSCSCGKSNVRDIKQMSRPACTESALFQQLQLHGWFLTSLAQVIAIGKFMYTYVSPKVEIGHIENAIGRAGKHLVMDGN